MTIYIVDIEAVDTRYTKQWKEQLPMRLQQQASEDVKVISGGEVPQATTPGAFLNFGGTNVYKSKQLETIAEMFCNGEVNDGDYFLYTDAWNPTVIQLRYMAELLNVKIKIGGLWHAGSYDPQDFLGRLIGDAPWVRSAEYSMFSCYDHNFFATEFHVRMFTEGVLRYKQHSYNPHPEMESVHRVGWPMEYLPDMFAEYKGMHKENIVLFPHRIAPEKQVDIFNDLKKQLPQYEFIVCQDKQLTKHEYHTLLGKAKVVFSANLQETLGISWYEGVLVNAIPMMPDRLSYREMALSDFKYPTHWTESWDSYNEYRTEVAAKLQDYMDNYTSYVPAIALQAGRLQEFFEGHKLYSVINNRST
jgi:hypothetical protein